MGGAAPSSFQQTFLIAGDDADNISDNDDENADGSSNNAEMLRSSGKKTGSPKHLNLDQFRKFSKGQYSRQLFEDLKDETSLVSVAKLKELLVVRKDCFLSYDWGVDEDGKDNRARVFRVNDWLKANGIMTWYHTGMNRSEQTVEATEQGISNSSLVLIFLTSGYIRRANTHDTVKDICRKEFVYSDLHKTPARILPIVMDSYSLDESNWVGPLQSIVGRPFVDLSDALDDQHFQDSMQRLLREILAINTPLMTKYLRQAPETSLYTPHAVLNQQVVARTQLLATVQPNSTTMNRKGSVAVSHLTMKSTSEMEEGAIDKSILTAVGKEDVSFEIMYRWLITYKPCVGQLSESEALQRFAVINALSAGDCSKRSKLGVKGAAMCQEALLTHVHSVAIAEHGCMALKNLAYASASKRGGVAAVGATAVVAAVRTHMAAPAVVENGLNALYQFARAPNEGSHSKDKLAKCGALAVVVAAMGAHLHTHPRIVEYGCGAIWHLCEGHAANKTVLGEEELGACALVLQGLKLHMKESYQITQTGLGAVAHLASDNGANKIRLAGLGACEIIVDAIDTHPLNVKVAEMACAAVSTMTKGNASNKTTLGTNGGSEALIATVHRHASITAVMEVCCMSIHNLASSDAVAAAMGAAGVCGALLLVLRTNRDSTTVVVEALKACMRLSAGAVRNAEQFRVEGLIVFCEEYMQDPNMPEGAQGWADKAVTLVSRACNIARLMSK